ncbi:MAG: hypothetical protein JWP74_3304 [Marmoricola sp.]|nr:hypothetical protein [Marmoricola sp.]
MQLSARRTAAAAACVVLATSGLAGCGSSSPARGKPLTQNVFIAKANAICRSFSTRTNALDPGTGATPAQYDVALKKVADVIITEVGELTKLNPPTGIASAVSSLLESITTAAHTLHDEGADALTSTSSPFDDAKAKAATLGLTDCGK